MSDICHLDLSLENLLLTKNRLLKICDFGLARDCKKNERFPASNDKPGKLLYMAPEIFEHKPFYGHKADIWSLGVTLFLMITGSPPWEHGPMEVDARFRYIYSGKISVVLTHWGFNLDPHLIDLFTRILCPQERRITLDEIFTHPWVIEPPQPPLSNVPIPSITQSQSSTSTTVSGSHQHKESEKTDNKYETHPSGGGRYEGETEQEYSNRVKKGKDQKQTTNKNSNQVKKVDDQVKKVDDGMMRDTSK